MSVTSDKRDAVRARLEEIEATHGVLRPSDVVADAKKKDSPLHGFFTWDTRKAAEERWLDQARDLIKSVYFRVTEEHRTISGPFFVRAPDLPSDEQGYTSIDRLRSDPEKARSALIAEFSRVAAL